MLDGLDRNTFYALRSLHQIAIQADKPIVIWVGAGASAWLGYPMWKALAEEFHSEFLKSENRYDRKRGMDALTAQDYPTLFAECKNANRAKYLSKLVDTFRPHQSGTVFDRLLSALRSIGTLHLLTTNVDESLEQNLPAAAIVQHSDLERCKNLIQAKQSFIGKLHGSISSVETTVFTREDYRELEKDTSYISTLKHIFDTCSVVFIGYSLRDQYVLQILEQCMAGANLFGNGPHFHVASSVGLSLPSSIQTIKYTTDRHTDHRGSITVLEALGKYTDPAFNQNPQREAATPEWKSIHFISDMYPPGEWTVSSTRTFESKDGDKIQDLMISGPGWGDGEIPGNKSVAMHDLVVGMICFDQVVVPVECVVQLLALIGKDWFDVLCGSGSLLLFDSETIDGVSLTTQDAAYGGLSVSKIEKFTSFDRLRAPFSDQAARSVLAQFPSRQAFEDWSHAVAGRVWKHEPSGYYESTMAALTLPHVRRVLGFSDAVPLENIPRWLMYPALRLMNVMKVGAICLDLGIVSTKLLFGAADLAQTAFSSEASGSWAGEIASYVLTSRLTANIGAYVKDDLSIIGKILSFRESAEGTRLRSEVLKQLNISQGAEFTVSLNAGLKSVLPSSVLEDARDRMIALLLPEPKDSRVRTAIWADGRYTDGALSNWRIASLRRFKAYCAGRNVGPYDPCPCGSLERVKFCCYATLSRS